MSAIADGWLKMDSITGGAHYYDRGLPACCWGSASHLDEDGRCLGCVQAIADSASNKNSHENSD